MEVVNDDGGEGEEDEVVEVEGDFVPRGPWAGDELGQDVLGDQDEPDQRIRMRKEIRSRCDACVPDAPHYKDEAEEEKWRSEFPEKRAPIVFVAEVYIGATFESVPD